MFLNKNLIFRAAGLLILESGRVVGCTGRWAFSDAVPNSLNVLRILCECVTLLRRYNVCLSIRWAWIRLTCSFRFIIFTELYRLPFNLFLLFDPYYVSKDSLCSGCLMRSVVVLMSHRVRSIHQSCTYGLGTIEVSIRCARYNPWISSLSVFKHITRRKASDSNSLILCRLWLKKHWNETHDLIVNKGTWYTQHYPPQEDDGGLCNCPHCPFPIIYPWPAVIPSRGT